jgi:hypothetical protein
MCVRPLTHSVYVAPLLTQFVRNTTSVCNQGEQLAEKLVVPRLRVRKDWHVGLNPDPVDHSHLDIGAAPDAQEVADAAAIARVSGRDKAKGLRMFSQGDMGSGGRVGST